MNLNLTEDVAFYANSVDHFGGHTFGCHENYLVDISASARFAARLSLLMPFLVTRQIFAGVGRVGGHKLNRSDFRRNIMTIGEHDVDTMWVADFYGVEIDPTVDYQLSQRADHIVNTVSSRVRFNRAIINPKRDSYYDYSDLHRLHVLVWRAEHERICDVAQNRHDLHGAGLARHQGGADSKCGWKIRWPRSKSVSRDPTYEVERARAPMARTISAIDLQRIYLEAAQKHLSGKDEQTDWALREWEDVLDGLERDPMQMGDRLDWVAKKQMLARVSWTAKAPIGSDDALH